MNATLDTQTLFEEYRRISFTNPLISKLITGDKEATVRYNTYSTVSVGDTLVATTTEQDPVAFLSITRTATVHAGEVHELIELFDIGYSSSHPQDVVETLNEHYSETITPKTSVNILVYEIEELLVDPDDYLCNRE